MVTDAQSRVITVRSPATGESLGEVAITSAAGVKAAVDRARAAQAAWGDLPVRERCRRIKAFRKAVLREAENLTAHLARENGKPRLEALLHDILPLTLTLGYFGRRAPQILRPRRIDSFILKNRASYLHYRPRGVIGIIAPWNFPLFLSLADAVMALIAGNAVVVKPSEVTPLITLRAKELWDGAGLPPDLLQVVPGGAETGKALIEAGPDHIVFTGSVASGRKVAVACAERSISCSLELGGKAAAIVRHDADLEQTARALVWGAFANSGQCCASVERVYAARSLYTPLVRRITELTRSLRQGDPSAGPCDVGSLTFPRQLDVAREQVADAIAGGATLETGGERIGEKGMYFAPTVLSGVRQEMRVMREETFGPILPIMPVDSDAEALKLANDSHLGLGGYVFGRDIPEALRVAEHIDAGSVMINDVIFHAGLPEMPWGGVKQSGIGRVHSETGLLEMVNVHHVNYPRFGLPITPWWYPYQEVVYQAFLKGLRLLFG
ncbi:MAG: aldehyde dehydrogenase family protein [Candidatus Sericytochromatia bacterium]|nr:aldehyde dehydrogenase family protein [Candidatus Tanganyikabacteria bacterium]